MRKYIRGIGLSSSLFLLTVGGRVLAACSPADKAAGKCVEIIETEGITVATIISNVTTWITNIVGAIAVLFIIWGGLQYVTAAGNKEKIESAKQTLTYAVIGIVVVVLAKIIVALATGTADSIITPPPTL